MVQALVPWTEALAGPRLGLFVLTLALGLGAALRLWLSFSDDGVYWPDEIYQSLEPAHRLVFGYGVIPWEFQEGARNWALPGFCAALLKLATLVGLAEPPEYLAVTKVVFSLVGVATAFAAFRLARAYGARPFPAACSAALFVLAAPAIYFGPRAMSETMSALPATLGLAVALMPGARPWQRILGASLLGAAVLFRLQVSVLCLGLLGIFALRRQWRLALEAGLVFLIWALIFGLLDLLTWGSWFHSAIVYLRYNLVEARSELYSSAPFDYYARTLWTSARWAILPILPLALLAAGRARGLLLTVLAFILVHSLIGHKELRFIFPALPILGALAGIGLDRVFDKWPGMPAALTSATVLMAAIVSAATFRSLTFGDLGQYLDPGYRAGLNVQPSTSAFDLFGPANRLLLRARQQPDLCGLKVEGFRFGWTGGYTYLHRPVPLIAFDGPPRESGVFNYVIAPANATQGGQVIALDRNAALLRVRQGGCTRPQ
jgi:GPI mannosyltransferase 3